MSQIYIKDHISRTERLMDLPTKPNETIDRMVRQRQIDAICNRIMEIFEPKTTHYYNMISDLKANITRIVDEETSNERTI